MALIVSPANLFQADSRSSRLRLASELESTALSRRVQRPYKCSDQTGRLSISNSSEFPLTSLPSPSFKNPSPLEEYNSSPRKSRKSRSRRNSESISHSGFERWHNEEGLENRLENLALAKVPNFGRPRDSFNKDFSAEGFDNHYSGPPLSDLAVPLNFSEWDSSVAIYKTAPSQGDSAGSSGVSRQSDKSGRRNRPGYGTRDKYGDFPAGGRGRPGGDDGEPPSLPQPIEPPASDGKKYYACWFWLYDPVKYHSCGDIRKEAHHLKHVHLPKHFPNGLPSTLKHRMNYDAVWYVLFPGVDLPGMKDRDERLLDMARQYYTSTMTVHPPTTASRRDSALLSPDSARYRSGAGEGRRRSSVSLTRARRHSSSAHNYPVSYIGSSSPVRGRSTRDSSSNAGSRYDANYDYITPAENTSYNYNEECSLIPDGDSIANPVAMYLEYDGHADMSLAEDMQIDGMIRTNAHAFYPINPRIKVVDSSLNDAYFWDERHSDTEFDFKNYYLIHFSDRTTGADMLLSINSMEVLEREYYFNMKARANSDGFVIVHKVHRSPGWPS
ncbi:hypothetical protein TWF106_010555 [Orbilia oligospora]|uniref:Uncharacterized protein n=1 Tax=Orbilia oligospora TaxID=2813651 RepID=A0A7C8V1U7_ORBOL|nr:hypothetical protein TWF106_010555 [Orbilia oligospora]